MNFTPAVAEIFHLVETDVGRPIGHIKARIPLEELQDDVRKVLRLLGAVERQIDNPTLGMRYIVRILPYRSVDNFIAGAVVTFVDITALTRAEDRQRLLLAELQHRVRNTLAVVRSIARRTAETSTTVEDYSMHLEGRLSALARTQSLVTRDPARGVDLEFLIAEELLAYHAQEGEQVVRISGPRVALRPKAAESLGLAFHELATNAVKYGALAQRGGRVKVTWTVEEGDGPVLILHWEESGVLIPSGVERRRGFGTELLERALNFELGAKTTLDFAPDGLRCTLEMPLPGQLLPPKDPA